MSTQGPEWDSPADGCALGPLGLGGGSAWGRGLRTSRRQTQGPGYLEQEAHESALPGPAKNVEDALQVQATRAAAQTPSLLKKEVSWQGRPTVPFLFPPTPYQM